MSSGRGNVEHMIELHDLHIDQGVRPPIVFADLKWDGDCLFRESSFFSR
jgi:hypothetical protein